MKSDVEDLRDSRVLDALDGARLVEEPFHVLFVRRDLGVQHLHRDPRADALLLAEVDLAHTSATEARHHPEVSDRLADHFRVMITPARSWGCPTVDCSLVRWPRGSRSRCCRSFSVHRSGTTSPRSRSRRAAADPRGCI